MSQLEQHQHHSNCQELKQEGARQEKEKEKEQPNSDTETNTTEETQEEKVRQPEPSRYQKNRAYLFNWCRNQCVKFTFFKETFINVIDLMDKYFKVHILEQQNFITIALSIMIISSKALERKVLYTSTVARNNKISFMDLLETEMKLLKFFKFRITSGNFLRAMNEYLKRWNDRIVGQSWAKEELFFYKDNLQSYMLYEEMYYLCQQYLKQRKYLRESTIKTIFKFFMRFRCNFGQLEIIIEQIFNEKVFSIKEENESLIQATEKNIEEQMEDLAKMRQHFIDHVSPFLKKNYQRYKNSEKYQRYEQFMAHLT